MRFASYLQRRASGVFHLRIAIPKSLRPYFQRREIKRSLATREPNAAQLAAAKVLSRYPLKELQWRGRSALFNRVHLCKVF